MWGPGLGVRSGQEGGGGGAAYMCQYLAGQLAASSWGAPHSSTGWGREGGEGGVANDGGGNDESPG